MKLLDRLFGRKRKKRSYEASGVGRLLQNWTTAIKTPDEELRTSLRNLRARSRELSINNDYARKFFEMLKTNVIGANGIVMQSKAKRLDGTFDRQDNERIEKAFKRWGHKELAIKSEGIEDTFKDIAVYSTLAMILFRKSENLKELQGKEWEPLPILDSPKWEVPVDDKYNGDESFENTMNKMRRMAEEQQEEEELSNIKKAQNKLEAQRQEHLRRARDN